MKSVFYSTLVTCVLLTSFAFAGNSDREFSILESRDIDVLTPEQCRLELAEQDSGAHFMGKEDQRDGLFKWVPNGLPAVVSRPECSSARIDEIMQTQRNGRVQAQALQDFFSQCGEHLARQAPSALGALAGMASMQYDLCEHPRMRLVHMRLADGAILRGFLALQETQEPRPLILIKCGLFCESGELTQKHLMAHLFDESPFHVLAINNLTSRAYVRDNQAVVLGGLIEGDQLLQVADLFKKSNLAPRISQFHTTGMSLGGQGSLYAPFLARYHGDQGVKFGGNLAICPVVELEPSIRTFFSDDRKGTFARWYFLNKIVGKLRDVPIVRELFPDGNVSNSEIPGRVALGMIDFLKTRRLPPPFENEKISTEADVWRLHRFLSVSNERRQFPTFAIGAADDSLVQAQSNYLPLQEKLKTRSGDDLNLVLTATGEHCAFSQMYGWDTATAIFRGFLLSQSAELSPKTASIAYRWQSPRLNSRLGEQHFSQAFELREHDDQMRLTFVIYMPEARAGFRTCKEFDPYNAPAGCFRSATIRLPLADLGVGALPVPESETHAQALTRYANTHLVLQDQQRAKLHLNSSEVAQIAYRYY